MEQARICDIALGDVDPEDFAELLAETVYTDADRERIAAMDADAARAECERVIADAAAQDGPGEWLGAREAAERAGVKERTWTAYVAREQAPQPTRRNPVTGKAEWAAVVIGEWMESLPGPGARTDLNASTE
jgi:hypothetical protein